MDALGINGGYLIVQIINFLIIVFVLNAWVFKPIVGLLETRRETIAQGLEDARIAAEARANAEAEAKKLIADAQSEAAEKAREIADRAAAQEKEVVAAAEGKASKIMEDARVDAQQEEVRVLGDLRGQVAALSMAAAQKLVGDALDEKRQHALINDFFSGVKAGKVVLLEDAGVAGAAAEVTSALPLTESEQQVVKSDVLAKMGSQTSVTFRVDTSILGGLVIRVGDKVLDGSVAGKLSSLTESLG